MHYIMETPLLILFKFSNTKWHAIHHFVSAASVELPNSIRINVVSPSVVTESIEVYGDYCPAFHSVRATNVTKYYVRSVVGIETGKVFMAYG